MKNDFYQLMINTDPSDDLYTYNGQDEIYKMIFIDTGMVTYLNSKDHSKFIKLLKSVISRNPSECSTVIR